MAAPSARARARAARWWSWTSPMAASWRFPAIPRSRPPPSWAASRKTSSTCCNPLPRSARCSTASSRARTRRHPRIRRSPALRRWKTAWPRQPRPGTAPAAGTASGRAMCRSAGRSRATARSISAAASSTRATPSTTTSATSSGMPRRTRASRQRCCRIS